MGELKINIDRIKNHLSEIGSVANAGVKGYTRLAYSKEEKLALGWLKDKLSKLDVSVYQDRIGNVFGRWGNSTKPAVAFGSHLDTVPEGGLYDGALGIVAGLECLETLMEHHFVAETPFELVCFVGEEANPLGGTFGSRAVSGLIKPSEDLEKSLKAYGYKWEDLSSAKRNGNEFCCFLEMHIEQGSILETAKKQVGIVTSIAGILRLSIRIKGRADHAGTTPMHLRDDALLSASRFIQEINQMALNTEGKIVATVGEISVSPNAANVVPGEVDLTVEIRGVRWEEMKSIEAEIRSWVAKHMNCEISVVVEKHPNPLSEIVQSCIKEACEKQNVSYEYLHSGANHDANSLTNLTNSGMIFLPSKDGRSHNPEEFTSWEDIEIGTQVMLQTLLNLTTQFR